MNKLNDENLVDSLLNAQALFAGGCFWCMEAPFAKLTGVKSITVGYTGGSHELPTYKLVSAGNTGHAEALLVKFDPNIISYESLLDAFWRNINPTDRSGQFADRGNQYRAEIFYFTKHQRKLAEESKIQLQSSGRFTEDVLTPISAASIFYPAEEYHQSYFSKNPIRYNFYRFRSGRDQFLKQVWQGLPQSSKVQSNDQILPPARSYSRPSLNKIQFKLSTMEFKVTQEEATEPAFKNEFWDQKNAGIYVDIVSGEPLFSSTHKFDSGTGWPSFWQVLDPAFIVTKQDNKLFRKRTEVRSKIGKSHLGHVFKDGPRPTNLRYCVNSAALRFIPVKDLKKEGYEEFNSLF